MMGKESISLLASPFHWKRKQPEFWLLIDPDKASPRDIRARAELAADAGVDAILVGSSILVRSPIKDAFSAIKSVCDVPVIIFPGGRGQLDGSADAILFLVFLSSRNPRWLVEEQVLAAYDVKNLKIPVIPTGYLLVDSGKSTSVSFFAGTPPLPSDKPEIAVAHALAAQFMGMHVVFLEAGSGAKNPVPLEIVKAVAMELDIPVIVGGGIRSTKDASASAKYADIIVIGNFFEKQGRLTLLSDFSDAIHGAR